MLTTTEAERQTWYAVCRSEECGNSPLALTLLGEKIVLWRDSAGKPAALRDLCIHRGTALSLGTVRGCEIVCPYHGWRFMADGRCSHIPQLEDPCLVPNKARVQSYFCQERYGLIWAALEKPRTALPEVPELESADFIRVMTGPFEWKSGAARQVENFTDFAHFPFVHPELLGDPERTFVPPYEVEREGNVLHYQITRPEAPNTDDFPVFGNKTLQTPVRTNRYELHVPYIIVLRTNWGGFNQLVSLFVSSPVDRARCRGYYLIARNYNLDQPAAVFEKFEDVIFGQDKIVVESQRPEQVPFDLSEELHLRFDRVAVNYRKAMKELGYAIE